MAVTVAVAAVSVASASQAATFATFTQVDSNPNVLWSNPGNTTGGSFGSLSGASLGAAHVYFSFLDPALAAAVSNVPADFNLVSSVPLGNPAINFGVLTQGALQGSFSFTYTGLPDLIVGATHFHTGANLLSGVFANGFISGIGSAGSAFAATASGSVISFTSAFKSFSGSVQRDFAINMTSITPLLSATPGKALKTFKASAGGAFSTKAVPEPSTWAIMITGFGMIGLAARRRRKLGSGASA